MDTNIIMNTNNIFKMASTTYSRYINTLNNALSTKCNKILIIDEFTKTVISSLFKFEDLLNLRVVNLMEINKLSNKNIESEFLTFEIIYFVLDNSNNAQLIFNHIKARYFNKNVILLMVTHLKYLSDHIKYIADADEYFDVKKTCSIICNFYPIFKNISLVKSLDQMSAFLLSHMKGVPSLLCCKDNLNTNMDMLKVLDGKHANNILYLSLDRSFDYITPLMTPWYYRSMIDYYFTINNNSITINNDIISLDDKFFNANQFMTYTDITQKINAQLDSFSKLDNEIKNLDKTDKVAYIRAVVHKYPAYENDLNIIKKHVKIIDEINWKISNMDSYKISTIEQQIVSGDLSFNDFKDMLLRNELNSSKLYFKKLITLAYIIYESERTYIAEYCNKNSISIIFPNNIVSRSNIVKLSITKKIKNPLQSNIIFFEHKPTILHILEAIFDPSILNKQYFASSSYNPQTLTDIYVHINGEITAEELRIISTFKHNSVCIYGISNVKN
jgi:hypothetical protein